MNEMKRVLQKYDALRLEIGCALREAGGASEALLNKNSWTDVLHDLALNNIVIEARWVDPNAPIEGRDI